MSRVRFLSMNFSSLCFPPNAPRPHAPPLNHPTQIREFMKTADEEKQGEAKVTQRGEGMKTKEQGRKKRES